MLAICDFMIRRNNSVYTEEIEKYGGKIILTAKFPQHILLNHPLGHAEFRNSF